MNEQLVLQKYPEDWNVATIDDLAVRVGSGVTPTGGSEVYKDRGIVFLRSQNITNAGLKLDDVAYIDVETHKKMEASRVEDFDVLINITGASIGRVTYVPKYFPEANVNQHVCEIRLHNSTEYKAKFLSYVLISDIGQRQIHCLNAGGNREGLNFQQLRSFVVPSPPESQIEKITNILSTVDKLIEKTQAIIDKHTAIKQGMMADFFTRGIDLTTGQLRPPVEQAPHLYKETELGWIPRDWDAKPLSDYFSYISYGFTNPMPEVDDGPYMITAANIFDGNIQYGTARHTEKQAYDTLLTKKSRPEIGDLLLTKDGSLGRMALVDKNNICINQSVAVFRPNSLCDISLVKYLLETEVYQQKMLDDAGGSTIKHIYITVIDKMLIGLPVKKEEQDRLIYMMENIHEEINILYVEKNKLVLKKQGLMQDILTGKVSV